jgi:GNAT superfamily N-acetyltransferase
VDQTAATLKGSPYIVRAATLDDVDVLVRHRIGMFTDMGVPLDEAALEASFRTWLAETIPSGTYRAWLVEDDGGDVAAGGGITILPWPPGPRYMGTRLAFVYNVYTEAGHRRRGLARLVMDTIHDWCRENGVASVALNASRDGLPLYQSMGYVESPAPMMFLPIVRV